MLRNLKFCSANKIFKSLNSKNRFSFFNSSAKPKQLTDLFNPTTEHYELRQMCRKQVTEFVEPQANLFNKQEKFNLNLFTNLGDLGLLGVTVDEKYGGCGMDAVASVIVNEELSYSDPGFCLSYLAHSVLLANNLAQNGSPIQKQKYLPSICSGKNIGGMCMSEPDCGTDVFAMKTTATKDGKYYILNGSKMWITNGCINEKDAGDVFLVYAKTQNSGDSRKDFSQFVVEKEFEGFSLGTKIRDKCGMRASPTAELVFDNCKVPKENLVGKEGDALICMMKNLEIERLTLAAMSIGISRRCIDIMKDYSNERKAFKNNLIKFGQIQNFLSECYSDYMAAKSYVYNTAYNTDLSKPGHRLNSDGAKLVAGKMAKRVADSAIQVLGGNGYIGEYVVERLQRDSKLLEIGGGTNEALQKNIAYDLSKIKNNLP